MDVEQVLRERLRSPWNYGVTSDGRIFFINEETRTTSWLHPDKTLAVQSGHVSTTSLSRGWELDHTIDGIPYYIDHVNQKTSFHNPVTGEHSMLRANINRSQEERKSMKKQKAVKPQKQKATTKTIKETPAPTRNFNAPVSLESWLFRPDSGKKTNWKKRWAVISDFCIYFYKDRDEREETGALSIPSYEISPVDRHDDVNRNHAFKASHRNMATQYFSALNEKEMYAWVEALKLAANVQYSPSVTNERSEEDEHFGFSQGQGQSQKSPQDDSMYRYDKQNKYPAHQQQVAPDPYAHKRYPSDHAESQSNSGSYGSARNPPRDPYSPNLTSSQQGSYRVSNTGSGGRSGNDPGRDSRVGDDSYRPDTLLREQSDPHGRGTLQRDNRLSRDPRTGDQRSVSPTSSTQLSTSGAPSVGYNRAYQAPPEQGYRQPPPVDRLQGHASQRSLSSDRYDNTLQRDSRNTGYSAQPVKRPPDEGYGTMDNLGQSTLDRSSTNARYNQRTQSDPRDHRTNQNTYAPESRNAPQEPVQNTQQPYNQPFRTNDSVGKSPLMRDKHGAADPRNVQARYPSDSAADVSRDRFSERPVDVPRGMNERTRDDESVSDDGGFNNKRPQQKQWSSPHDIRSDPSQLYRDSFHGDRSRDQPTANQQGRQWRPPSSQSSASDSLRRPATQGYPQPHIQPTPHPPSQSTQQTSQHERHSSYDRSRPQEAQSRLAPVQPPVNGVSPTSDRSSSQSSRSLQGQRYQGQAPTTRQPAEGQYWDSRQRGQAYGGGVEATRRGMNDGRPEAQQQRYFEPLTIDTVNLPGQNVSRVETHGTPLLQADAYPSQSPGRPPLPSELMPQYVQELAEASTPVTRQDMLTSMQTALQRKVRESELDTSAKQVAGWAGGEISNDSYYPHNDHYDRPNTVSGFYRSMPNLQANQPPPLPKRTSFRCAVDKAYDEITHTPPALSYHGSENYIDMGVMLPKPAGVNRKQIMNGPNVDRRQQRRNGDRRQAGRDDGRILPDDTYPDDSVRTDDSEWFGRSDPYGQAKHQNYEIMYAPQRTLTKYTKYSPQQTPTNYDKRHAPQQTRTNYDDMNIHEHPDDIERAYLTYATHNEVTLRREPAMTEDSIYATIPEPSPDQNREIKAGYPNEWDDSYSKSTQRWYSSTDTISDQDQAQNSFRDNRDKTSRQPSYQDNNRQPSYQANQPGYQGNQPIQKDTSRQSSYRDNRQPGHHGHGRQSSNSSGDGRAPSYRGSQAGSAHPTPSMQRRPDQGAADNQSRSRGGSTQPSPWMDRRNQPEIDGHNNPYGMKQAAPMPQTRDQRMDQPLNRQPHHGRDVSGANESSYQPLQPQEPAPYQPGPLAALLSNQRPVPPKLDPPKSATEQFRENRKSGDYSRELEDKEMHRLRKHIDASYKRLSLGSELGRQFIENEESEKESGLIHHARAASYGGDVTHKARRSLDWEMENSLFSSSVVNSSHGDHKFSTPLDQYPAGDNRTYLPAHSPDSLYNRVPDGQPSSGFLANRNINNNLIPSPTSGFSKFVSDAQHEDADVRRSYAEKPDVAFGDYSTRRPFTEDSMRQSYLENDNVAIVDVEEGEKSPIADVMEDIGMDVINIKERINSLRHLMEVELADAKGSPLPSDVSFERESAEGEQLRDASQRLFFDQREEARLNLRVSDSPQRHSYAGYQDNANIDILPPRHSLAHYDGAEHSSYQAQNRDFLRDDLRYPPQQSIHSQNVPSSAREPSQPHSFTRQESDRSLNASNRHYVNMSPHTRHDSQRDLPSKRSSYSSQDPRQVATGSDRYGQAPGGSDRYGQVPTAMVDGSQRNSYASTNERAPQKAWQPTSAAEPMDMRDGPNRPQNQYTFEGINQDLRPLPGESPFKHVRSPGTRDDSVLFDGPRSWQNQDSNYNQNRPKSYAGGLIGVPLTKLEKLEMENNISKSMGTLNMNDLEESAKILTGQADSDYNSGWGDMSRPYQTKDDTFNDPYGRAEYAPPVPPKSPGVARHTNAPLGQFEIAAIKEDPNMADSEVLDDKKLNRLKQSLDQHRLRLSISANDLIGKSHEELVLLLIQLKRAQARLETDRDYYRTELEQIRPTEKQYKLKRKNSVGRLEDTLEQEHEEYVELRKQAEEIENQLEVHKPLVNLVDNLVTMGSLYGGDNLMLASQFKKHKLRPDQYIEPKEMIEFSRKHQEQRLLKEQEEDLRKLTEEEIELEEKLSQLFELDKALQNKSVHVSNLQEDRELLDKAMQSLLQTIEWETDPREQRHLQLKKQTLQDELTMLRQRLAEVSKDLEETTAENAKVENEVILLRKKVYGLNKSHSSPNLTTESMKSRMKMERELDKVQAIMQGLSQQGAQLQQTMNTLRRSEPDLASSPKSPKYDSAPSKSNGATYYETDMDSMTSRNIAVTSQKEHSSRAVNHSSLYSPPGSRDQIEANQKLDLNQNSVYNQSDRWNSNRDFNKSNNNYSHRQEPRSTGQGHYSSDVDASRGEDGIYTAKRIFVQSPAPSRKNIPVTEVHPQSRFDESSSDVVTSPMDISEADDNTKRFYGILPKEKTKSQTVRDLKKRESERKSRDVLRSDDGTESDVDARARSSTSGGSRMRSQSLPRHRTDDRRNAPNDRRNAPNDRYNTPDDRRNAPESPAATKKFSELVRRPRKTRDPERRKSAAERLFTANGQQALPTNGSTSLITRPTPVNLNDKDSLRRMSDIFTPRPFGAPSSRPTAATIRPIHSYTTTSAPLSPPRDEAPREGEPHDIEDEQPLKPQVKFAAPGQRNSPITVATVRPVPNPSAGLSTSQHTWKPGANTATVRPNNALTGPEAEKHRKVPKSALKNKRNEPRRQTISSSQPAWFEQSPSKEQRLHTAAGDLISVKHNADFRNVIKSSSVTDMNFDDETIDKMVLFMPSKVEIPERYVPDSDDESITEEQRLTREEKSASIRKLVVAQSLQDWNEGEIGARKSSVHTSLAAEQHRREHVLDLRQALAREVTQRSKQVAVSMRDRHAQAESEL